MYSINFIIEIGVLMLKKSLLFFVLFLMNGCGNYFDGQTNSYAVEHQMKLRQHFSGMKRQDISTLISETAKIANELKMSGQTKLANKFDSYIDVLTYGQHTIPESIRDVRCLMKNKPIEVPQKTKCCITLPF